MAFVTGQRLTSDLLNQNFQGATTYVINDSGNITTTETTIASVTLSVTSGQVYGLTFKTSISSAFQMVWNVNPPTFELALIRLREDNSTGTQITNDVLIMPTSSTNGYPLSVYAEYTAVSNVSKVIVATLIKNVGTGPMNVRASVNRPTTLRMAPLVN